MTLRFNEAAGNTPRKTRQAARGRYGRWHCFNEAAGNTPRKTQPRPRVCVVLVVASMRPRGIPRGKRRS